MSAFSFQLRRERSVVEVINATFEFVRLNGTVFGKTLLYIVAPIGILFATAAAGTIAAIDWDAVRLGGMDAIANNMVALGGIIGAVGLFFLLYIVGSVLVLVATMSIVELSERKEPGAFDLSDVWSRMKKNLMGLFLLAVISLAALYIPYIILSLASVFGLLLYFVYWIYVQPRLSMIYAAYVIERKSGVNAVRRAHQLTERGFGATLGLYILMYFLTNALASATALPSGAISTGITLLTGGTGNEGLLVSVVLAAVYGAFLVASIAIGSFLHIAMSLQYFHLVEKGDHVGLRQKVDALADGVDLDDAAPATRANGSGANGSGASAPGKNAHGGSDAEAGDGTSVRGPGSDSEARAEDAADAKAAGEEATHPGRSGNGAETSGKTAPVSDASRWGRPSSRGDGNVGTGDGNGDASGEPSARDASSADASTDDAASDDDWTPPARS